MRLVFVLLLEIQVVVLFDTSSLRTGFALSRLAGHAIRWLHVGTQDRSVSYHTAVRAHPCHTPAATEHQGASQDLLARTLTRIWMRRPRSQKHCEAFASSVSRSCQRPARTSGTSWDETLCRRSRSCNG